MGAAFPDKRRPWTPQLLLGALLGAGIMATVWWATGRQATPAHFLLRQSAMDDRYLFTLANKTLSDLVNRAAAVSPFAHCSTTMTTLDDQAVAGLQGTHAGVEWSNVTGLPCKCVSQNQLLWHVHREHSKM